MKSNRRQWMGAFPGAAVAAVATARGLTARADDDNDIILRFGSMRGNPDVAPPNKFIINDNVGARFPWVLAGAEGLLTSDGDLEVVVQGLVFANAPSVVNAGITPGTVGPIKAFLAIVSCTAVGADGLTPEVVNLATPGFAITGNGNSVIRASGLALPDPCFAPIVFVGPAAAVGAPAPAFGPGEGGTWFAATGF